MTQLNIQRRPHGIQISKLKVVLLQVSVAG